MEAQTAAARRNDPREVAEGVTARISMTGCSLKRAPSVVSGQLSVAQDISQYISLALCLQIISE